MDNRATAAVWWIGTVQDDDDDDKPAGLFANDANVEGAPFSGLNTSTFLFTPGYFSSDFGSLSMRIVGEISSTNFCPFKKRFNRSYDCTGRL